MSIDPEQSQLRMVPGGDGVFYSVQADGRLLFYRHHGWQTGLVDWADGGMGVEIDAGWHMFTTVLAAADGQLFGFGADGTVRWYRYLVASGTWAPRGGTVIGTGFDRYARVSGGWDGVFYAVDRDGAMHWFRYLAGDGSSGPDAWANAGRPLLVKPDVRFYQQFVADQGGVLYGVFHAAELHWFRHDGGGRWANDGVPVPIGTGWTGEFQREFTAQGGSLYSVFVDRASPPGPDHELNWFRLANWRDIPVGGRPDWSHGGAGKAVGTGWTTCRTANLQGYASAWSAPAGGSLGVKVSATVGEFQAAVQRLDGPLPAGGTTVWGPVTLPARLQPVQPGYRRQGCGWSDDFTVPVDAAWPSGLHAVTLTGPLGMRRHVPFVVRPAAPVNRLAVLLPTLTHNAYNSWGGHSQYTWDAVPTNRYVTLRRPFANADLEGPGHADVRWHGDLLLLRWLKDNAFAYDCYQDLDLHTGDWLGRYRAVLLGSHPEYWTLTMRGKLADYLSGGGRVVSPGGNVLYEPVDLADGGATAVHRDPFGNRIPYAAHGLPPHEVVGNSYVEASFLTFGPYEVLAEHPFLAGTGLTAGSRFGHTGRNGPASGWEVDATPPGLPGARVVASGVQEGGADMVHFTRGSGWAFAVGSLTYVGALDDPVVSRVLRNALTAALA